MPLSKQALRKKIWRGLMENGVALFPGARGRIPNFLGAEPAASQLATLHVWSSAEKIKSNPDSPQRHVRYAALREGKVVYMAVPRLRDRKPFIELDPSLLKKAALWRASSIKGAFAMGKPVALEEMSSIDLIVAGSVAVSPDGGRLGKGGGYSDLEYALCREVGLANDQTPIVTTVHSLQVVPEDQIVMTPHDISLDWLATPEKIIKTNSLHPRPPGILWAELGEKLDQIPVLKHLATGRR